MELTENQNVYRLQIINGTEQAQLYKVSVRGLPGMLISSERQLEVQSIGIGTLPIRLTLPPDVVALHRGETLPIVFEIQTSNRGQNEVRQEKSTFYVLP